MVAFCQAIQFASPINSHVTAYPAYMPGYEDDVIMAAGTFIQGASIELTADGPIRPPLCCLRARWVNLCSCENCSMHGSGSIADKRTFIKYKIERLFSPAKKEKIGL